jgi:phasin family protein
MSSQDQSKPGGKHGQRKRKAEKPRSKKPDQPQSPAPERREDADKQIDMTVAPSETASIGAAAPADALPIGLHTIATAYGDYTRKSLEETRSFVEKLSEARSLEKAVEAQTEFAKQAYETFVAESQKMRDLYGKLARQTLKPLEGFVTKSTPTPR